MNLEWSILYDIGEVAWTFFEDSFHRKSEPFARLESVFILISFERYQICWFAENIFKCSQRSLDNRYYIVYNLFII